MKEGTQLKKLGFPMLFGATKKGWKFNNVRFNFYKDKILKAGELWLL